MLALLISAAYTWYSQNFADAVSGEPTNSPAPTASLPQTASVYPTSTALSAFIVFTSHYLDLMHSLNSSVTKTAMAPYLNPSYNQTTLFAWEKSHMTFTQDSNGFYENPLQIMASGKGICVQWSIVYVSACLSLGYPSRIVVAADTSNWNFIHTWAEDYVNGTWVPVDPSDAAWNMPWRYQSWDWGPYLGSGVRVFAFEDGRFQDVTATYSAHSG